MSDDLIDDEGVEDEEGQEETGDEEDGYEEDDDEYEEEGEEEGEEDDEEDDEEDIDPEVKKFLDAKLDDEVEDDDDYDETDDDPDDLDADQLDDDYEEDESNELLDDVIDLANGIEDDDDILGDDDEDDGGLPSDQQIATAMRGSERYEDWFKQAVEDGERIEDEFAAMVAKSHLGAKILSENSIYSMKDMVVHLNALHERISPDAVLVPAEDDHDGWRELIGYPEDIDGYSQEIFEGTFLEDKSEEELEALLTGALEHQFIPEQLSFLAEVMEKERQAFLENGEESDLQYRSENRAELESFFGTEYKDIMTDINKFFAKYGREFVDEHKGTNVMSSAALVKMIYNAINDVSTPSKVSFGAFSKSLASLKDEQILDLEAKTLQDKYYNKSYATSKNPKLRKAHRLARARVRAVQSDIDRRGLE